NPLVLERVEGFDELRRAGGDGRVGDARVALRGGSGGRLRGGLLRGGGRGEGSENDGQGDDGSAHGHSVEEGAERSRSPEAIRTSGRGDDALADRVADEGGLVLERELPHQ